MLEASASDLLFSYRFFLQALELLHMIWPVFGHHLLRGESKPSGGWPNDPPTLRTRVGQTPQKRSATVLTDSYPVTCAPFQIWHTSRTKPAATNPHQTWGKEKRVRVYCVVDRISGVDNS
jgi:hypothetical protein